LTYRSDLLFGRHHPQQYARHDQVAKELSISHE